MLVRDYIDGGDVHLRSQSSPAELWRGGYASGWHVGRRHICSVEAEKKMGNIEDDEKWYKKRSLK